MFKNKMIAFIFFIAVMVPGLAYCQQDSNGHRTNIIIGKVDKVDVEGGVINVMTGKVTKEVFSDPHINPDDLWAELIKNGYIDLDGTVRLKYYQLFWSPGMHLPAMYKPQISLIYSLIEKSITEESMEFNISTESDLLRGRHHIASIEISPGDPVRVEYETTSSDQNNIIRLVDYKAEN